MLMMIPMSISKIIIGAFFYYNQSRQLVFGKLPSTEFKDLNKSPNVASASYALETGDPNFRFVSHNYENDSDMASDVADLNNLGANKLVKIAVDASTERKPNYAFYIDNPQSLPENPQAEDYGDLMLFSSAGGLGKCSFISYLLDLEPGSFVKINDNGLLLVTSAHLTWDCNGSPQNEITAMMIPNDDPPIVLENIFPPYLDINAYPKSSAQRAVVVNNVDPKKMGRVQVQFVWQKAPANDQEKADIPWIRIAQPYGGDQKGCYILPEIGEEVMVGFEHENMEKPFVIGTLYHGKDDNDQNAKSQLPDEAWLEDKDKNKENEVKAFRTKKGHTIEIHDTKEGDGFIRIYGNNKKDEKNYDIILSTDKIQKVNGNNKEDYQFVSADEQAEADQDIKEKKDYNAGELRIMVRSNGGDIMLDAGEGDIIMNAKNIRVNATGNTTSFVKGKNIVKVEGAQLVDVGSNSLMVQEDQQVHIKGTDNEKYDKTILVNVLKDVKLEAKSLDSKTDQKTEVKAGTISANANQNIEVNANGSAKMTAKTGLELNGGSQTDVKGTNVSVEGRANAKLTGIDVTVEGTFTTTVKAADLTIDATAGTRRGMWLDE